MSLKHDYGMHCWLDSSIERGNGTGLPTHIFCRHVCSMHTNLGIFPTRFGEVRGLSAVGGCRNSTSTPLYCTVGADFN